MWNAHLEVEFLREVLADLREASGVPALTPSSTARHEDLALMRARHTSPDRFLMRYLETLEKRFLSFGPAVEEMQPEERDFVRGQAQRLLRVERLRLSEGESASV